MNLSYIINRLRNNKFFSNLATLSAGTIVAQVIPFIASVIISRLYNPEEMGEWGVFAGYAAILSIIGCLKYDSAIVKSNNKSDAYQLTYITIFLSFVFTVVLYLCAIIIHAFDMDIRMSRVAMYLLPLYVFTLLLVQILSNLSTFLREYKLIATNSVNRSLSQTGSRILLGFVKTNRQGMIIGSIIGNIISLFTLGSRIGIIKNRNCLQRDRAIELVKENKNFPLYDLPGNLLNSISSNCTPILLSWYFMGPVVGLFSMAHSLLYMPMSVIGSSISQLYYKDASEISNLGNSISLLTKRLFLSLFVGGVFIMVLLIISESWLFGFVLGSRWNDVGKYVVILSPWLLLVTAFSPLSTVFYVKGKQKVNMNLNLIGMISRVAAIVISAVLCHNSDITILSFSIVSTLFFLAQGCFIMKYGEVSFKRKEVCLISFMSLFFLCCFLWKTLSYFTGV